MTGVDAAGSPLPDQVRRYLAEPSLAPVWDRVRQRLERNRLSPVGTVTVELDPAGAQRLSGLLGSLVPAGRTRVRLDRLDAALRASAAAAGLVTVVAELTGAPLVDRTARREADNQRWGTVWGTLDRYLAEAGFADAPWAPGFVDELRRTGMLTRAGDEAATRAVRHAAAVLGVLAEALTPGRGPADADAGAAGGGDGGGGGAAGGGFELAELASRCTGDAHALDEGRLAAALVLRAACAARGLPVPRTAAGRRALWAQLGVAPDIVSTTVLVWGLRPPGDDSWSAMMRARADLGVVTHLTAQELRGAAAGRRLCPRAEIVYACENPQVIQAAARAGADGALVCFSGNLSGVDSLVLGRLVEDGGTVRYHGDFDWPGIAITGRVLGAGALPWRMGAADYLAAVETLSPDARLELSGVPVGTPWDERLATVMRRHRVAVHEESVLPTLLTDLTDGGHRRGRAVGVGRVK